MEPDRTFLELVAAWFNQREGGCSSLRQYLDSRSAPAFDHNLWHRFETHGNGARVHDLANRAAAYKGFWDVGQRSGWTDDRRKGFAEADRQLRKALIGACAAHAQPTDSRLLTPDSSLARRRRVYVRRGTRLPQVVEALRALSGPFRPKDIAVRIGMNPSAVTEIMNRLAVQGRVRHVRHGVWEAEKTESHEAR